MIRRAVAAALAGALIALSVPPAGFWPAGIAGIGALAWSLRDATWWRRALLGLLTGTVLFTATLSWILAFTGLGFVVLIALEASFFAFAAVLAGPRFAIALAPAIVLTEAVRSTKPLGGLPMGGIALGQAAGPLAATARVGGPLLVVASTAALGAAFALRGVPATRVARGVVVFMAVGLLVAGSRVAPSGGGDREAWRIAAVQGGGERGFRKSDVDPDTVLARHLVASDRVRTPVDVVLWPEDVIDVEGPVAQDPAAVVMGNLARRLDSTVVAGVVEGEGRDRFRNAAVVWGRDGAIIDRYEKVHRVPFGEWVPHRAFFGRFADLSAVPRDAVPGTGVGVIRLARSGERAGVLISFEVFDSARARLAARAGGEFLLVPTNTASYRGTQVPEQETAAVRLRALETGRWVVQASPTGHALLASPDGRIRARTGLDVPAVLHATVYARHGRTLYARLGDLPVLLGAGLLLVCLRSPVPRRRPRGPGPAGQEPT